MSTHFECVSMSVSSATRACALVLRTSALCAAVLVAVACTQPEQQFHAGEDQSAIIARMGPPKEVYDLPNGGKRLMWPTQPMGSTTVAADVDASGKIVSVRQVLQANEFYRAQVDKWTRNDVLINFGKPMETSYLRLSKREVWSYRYVENNVTYLLYNFLFDDEGVLRQTQKSPDPLRDRDRGRF
jgi:hypothetical protein